jgi:hypothetical protein
VTGQILGLSRVATKGCNADPYENSKNRGGHHSGLQFVRSHQRRAIEIGAIFRRRLKNSTTLTRGSPI